jgi:hypothetical protein
LMYRTLHTGTWIPVGVIAFSLDDRLVAL